MKRSDYLQEIAAAARAAAKAEYERRCGLERERAGSPGGIGTRPDYEPGEAVRALDLLANELGARANEAAHEEALPPRTYAVPMRGGPVFPIHYGPDALAAWLEAEAQAARLAPPEVAPQFLAEAIWLRTLAFGTLAFAAPTDTEVLEYVARCASDHRPVSGRSELEPGIAPVEVYEGGAVGWTEGPDRAWVEVRRRGRGEYVATRVIEATGERTELTAARSRAKAHRKAETLYPGGRWSSRLLSSEVAEIRRRWGLAETGDPR